MQAANDRSGRRADPDPNDDVVLEPAPELAADEDAAAAAGELPGRHRGDDVPPQLLRTRLATVAGFLTVFHLAFAIAKLYGSGSAAATASDAPLWTLLLRAAVAGAYFLLLRVGPHLGRRVLRLVEGGLFGFEMLVLLAAQYLAVIDLIDSRDLIDAVAVQKNGVIRSLVLMVCYGVFIPRAPATTARIVVTMAAAVIICQGMVLHHADTKPLDIDDIASHQIVIVNALFLMLGVALATLAARVLPGRTAPQDGDPRVGGYRLIRKLDDGGTGTVFLAEHEALRRPCAVKLVGPGDPDTAERFEREVRAAARLAHPNTVAIFDSGRTDDGTSYCAMEYLPGLCVADIVQASGPLPASRAVHLGQQVCGALAEAHRVGLVHGDLSPANVFVSVLGGRCDVAKVLDFSAVDPSAAAGSTIAGTPEYLAPEHAVAGRGSDGRADVYSLGALLYFMVAGRPPFERSTPAEVLQAHLSAPVPPLREQAAGIPADLEAVILRCLAKRPDDRYPDARAVADALAGCGCAAQWDDAHAEAWWLEQASGSSAGPAGEPPPA